MLAELGLRPGEADALTWSDVDLDAAVVSISRSMKRGDGGAPFGVGRPKTAGSSRRLRLTIACLAALRRRMTQQATERLTAGGLWSDDERWSGLVFTSETGTPMHPSNVRRSLAAAIKRANAAIEEANVDLVKGGAPTEPEPLVPRDFTPYEFGRHTAASLLVDAGASPYQVADQLGHTTTRMLDRHYRHRVTDIVDTAAAIERQRDVHDS